MREYNSIPRQSQEIKSCQTKAWAYGCWTNGTQSWVPFIRKKQAILIIFVQEMGMDLSVHGSFCNTSLITTSEGDRCCTIGKIVLYSFFAHLANLKDSSKLLDPECKNTSEREKGNSDFAKQDVVVYGFSCFK